MDFTNVDWNKAVENTLADYEQQKNASQNSDRQPIDLTKYFTLRLEDNQNSGVRTFRILPLDTDGKWYDIVKFHSLKVGNRWVKLYDPAQDGEDSPLNNMYKQLMNGDSEDKKLANSYRSRDFYIVRGIERGKESEGVKFWRFPKVYDGSGIMDKIQPMMKHLNDKNPGSGAFFNPIMGRDLVISVVKDSNKKYAKVSQIIFDDPSPLSENEELMTQWLNDETTHTDMFRKKPFEYLEIIAQGGEPVWDSDAKKFVAKSDNMAYGQKVNPEINIPTPMPVSVEQTIVDAVELDTDDLPF